MPIGQLFEQPRPFLRTTKLRKDWACIYPLLKPTRTICNTMDLVSISLEVGLEMLQFTKKYPELQQNKIHILKMKLSLKFQSLKI